MAAYFESPPWGKIAAAGLTVAAAGATVFAFTRKASAAQPQHPGPPPAAEPAPAPQPAPAPAPQPQPAPAPQPVPQPQLGPEFAPALADPRWGNVPADWRAKIKEWSDLGQIPYLWAFLAVVMRREAGYNPQAQNNSAGEVSASKSAITAGTKRGNPPPKFAAALGDFGSGGFFGALAPYWAWIGMDEGYMPFLKRKPTLIFNPDASAVFGMHYAWRVLAKYKVRDWFDLRTGWASPSVLKSNPDGSTAKAVRARMVEDLNALGLNWLADAPVPSVANYPGIKITATAYNFTAGQED